MALAVALTAALGFGVHLYCNYRICEVYFSKVDPWVCMLSSKTRVAPEATHE